MHEKKQDDFKIIVHTLVNFSLPLIGSGILQQLYNWADAFIVGNVEGELALGAIGATTTIINFYIMAIIGFTLGLSILVGQKFGKGEMEYINKILAIFSVLLGLLSVIIVLFSVKHTLFILQALHTTEDIIVSAQIYLQIILLGIPFLAIYNVYSAVLRGIGDTRAPFLAVLISSVINVILDIVFVVILRWGVEGAAVATVFSQIGMTLFLVLYTIKKYAVLRYSFSVKMLDRAVLIKGLYFGMPPLIQSCVSASGNLVLQNFMNSFGTQTVIAVTTAYRIDTITLLPIINFGSGIATLVAQCYGAGKLYKAKKICFAGIAVMLTISVLLTVLIVLFGGYLISLFGAGEQATAIGQDFFVHLGSFYFIFGIATALRGYVEGMGDIVYSSLAGIISLIFRIIASYALVDWGNMIIAYAEAFSWIVLLLLYMGRMYQKKYL